MPRSPAEDESPVENSVTAPCGVIRPMRAGGPFSVNHRLPSGPVVMNCGVAPELMPAENSVILPCVVMRPMRPLFSVNQRLPSGPTVIPTAGCPRSGRCGTR